MFGTHRIPIFFVGVIGDEANLCYRYLPSILGNPLTMDKQALLFLIAGEKRQLVLMHTGIRYNNHPTEVLIRKGKYSWNLKVKVTLRKRTGKIPRKLFLQDILIPNLLSSHLQKTQDPKCKLRIWFDVQIFLNHSINRHELTSNALHP